MRREFDGAAQPTVLRRLHRETKRLHRQVAGPLEIDTNTWRAYVRGDRPLRADMLATVAAAFGVSLRDLNEAVGWLDDEQEAPPGWNLRRELHEAMEDDPEAAERAYVRLRHEPYDIQAVAVDAFRAAYRDESEAVPVHPRAVPPGPDEMQRIVQRTPDREAL